MGDAKSADFICREIFSVSNSPTSTTNSYPVPNPINRYVLGSDYPDMKKNADGSLTIYLQADDPGPDKEANWLPAPRGPFLLILGTYAPGEAMIESLSDPKAYVPPGAVPIQ